MTVNGQTAWRKGEYFWSTVGTNNSASAKWLNVAVGSAGWTNNGNLYFPRTPESFQYDADGNLTNDGRWSYVWDAENRLIQMTVNTNVGPQYQLDFAYDAQGRRIQKLVSTNNGSGYVCVSTNNFVYDGWNVVAIFDSALSLQPLAFFVWGNDLSGSPQGAGGVGGLLEESFYGSSRTNCFYAYDGNGNVAALVNTADGTIGATYEYGPFGEVIRSTGPMAKANHIRFSTKYQDDESDLVYYGYRYYKSITGDWLSRDLVGEASEPNIFCFVGNNGVNEFDWLGLASIEFKVVKGWPLAWSDPGWAGSGSFAIGSDWAECRVELDNSPWWFPGTFNGNYCNTIWWHDSIQKKYGLVDDAGSILIIAKSDCQGGDYVVKGTWEVLAGGSGPANSPKNGVYATAYLYEGDNFLSRHLLKEVQANVQHPAVGIKRDFSIRVTLKPNEEKVVLLHDVVLQFPNRKGWASSYGTVYGKFDNVSIKPR